MPLFTQLLRDSQPVPLRWGWWHMACLQQALEDELSQGIPCGVEVPHDSVGPNVWVGHPPYTYSTTHRFVDPADGEVFIIQPGDVYTTHTQIGKDR